MSKFRVLLVYPNLQMVNILPTNIATLAGYLKANDIECHLFDTTLYKTAEKSVDEIRVEHMQLRPFNLVSKGVSYKASDVYQDFVSLVESYCPNLIAVTVTDDTYDLGVQLISQISPDFRQRNEMHVIFGGVYSTFSPDEVIKHPLVDSLCIGEGEEALVELCKNLMASQDISSIRNLWVKQNSIVVRNPLRPPVDINQLPYEDFTIFESERFFRPMQGKVFRMIPVSLDRGCPFNCAFCAAPVTREIYRQCKQGPYFRTKSIDRILAELRYHVQQTGADYIYFNTETFFARKDEELEAFSEAYKKEIGLPFWCQTRVETINEWRVSLLKAMNCDRISIGLEHGNEDFRMNFLQKRFTNQQAIDAFAIIGRSGIPVTVNNIIGWPDETREMVFDTIRLNRQIKADTFNAYYFVPYSGTFLRDYCLKKGYLKLGTKTDSLMRSSILEMPQFSRQAIEGLVRTFPLYVKMPESVFSKIHVAEQLSPEGDRIFNELREQYWQSYFK